DRTLRFSPKKCGAVIAARAVLQQNVRVLKNDEADGEMQDENEDGDDEGGKNEENDNLHRL
uniref:Uncharacterized protein n=1 Tax=Romanomermis culicivorax TaxID=13658 RepID=A0A915IUZ5_ROMCU